MLALALTIAVIVAGIALTLHRAQEASRRRERMLAFAVARGWSFDLRDPSLVDRWVGFPFGRGERREATAVVRGTVGDRTFVAFEYTFVVPRERGTGRPGVRTSTTPLSHETQRFSVVVVDLPASLPRLVVQPENALDRVGLTVGVLTDIELESEDFNRRYRVGAGDPKVASDVLTPRTMRLLLSRPPIAFRSEGAQLLSWQRGGIDPMDVLRRASTLGAVADLVPSFVWRDRGAREDAYLRRIGASPFAWSEDDTDGADDPGRA